MRVVAECRIQMGDSKIGLTLNSTIEKSKAFYKIGLK
jgi:hypothetical protein